MTLQRRLMGHTRLAAGTAVEKHTLLERGLPSPQAREARFLKSEISSTGRAIREDLENREDAREAAAAATIRDTYIDSAADSHSSISLIGFVCSRS